MSTRDTLELIEKLKVRIATKQHLLITFNEEIEKMKDELKKLYEDIHK